MNKREIEEYEKMLRDLELLAKSYRYDDSRNNIAMKTIWTEELEKWR